MTAPAEPSPATPPAPDRESMEAAAHALVNAWVETQNRGDFTSYMAFYEPQLFTGIRRTSNGHIRKLDHDGWKNDRGHMFRKPMTVAVEDVRVRTWLEDGTDLPSGVTTVHFVQRWKSGGYADHGPKVLRLRWESEHLRIVYEDMLRSHSGWTAPSDDRWEELRRLSEAIEWNRLDEADVHTLDRETLIELANYGSCEAAMSVAIELASRGDRTWLPRRPETDDAERLARILCMLPSDPDTERAVQVFREFLPPRGAVEVILGDCSGDSKATHRITRAAVAELPYSGYFGAHDPPSCWNDSNGAWTCTGNGGSEGWVIVLSPGADRKLYIDSLENFYLASCGC